MKPCAHCGRPLENDAETCPACGRETARPPGVADSGPAARVPRASPGPHGWTDQERKEWLRGELRAALRVVLGSALEGVVFVAVGGLIGYLVGDLRGLAVGGLVGMVVFVVRLVVL